MAEQKNPPKLQVIDRKVPKQVPCRSQDCKGVMKIIPDSKGGETWFACTKCGTTVSAEELFEPRLEHQRVVDERREYLKWWLSPKKDK